jgi:hypothetical protein
MHVLLEAAAAVLAVIPVAALSMAYRRTRSPRLILALLAFIALEVRSASLVVIHTLIGIDHSSEEMLDFAGDLAVMTIFAVAFLYGTGWWGIGRTPSDTA